MESTQQEDLTLHGGQGETRTSRMGLKRLGARSAGSPVFEVGCPGAFALSDEQMEGLPGVSFRILRANLPR